MTAGIETTICAPQWIDGINRMDLTLVSSNHAKKVFEDSKFEEKNNQTGQTVRNIKLEKPVEVLFEGANIDIYKKVDKIDESQIWDVFDYISEEFNFLYVGHWLQGELGEDRKNTGMLIKTFLETFKDQKQKPGLILKTSSVDYSVLDREEILDRIRKIISTVEGNNLPQIYLLHGELSDEEVNNLYNHPKVKAHVSFTKGEGYGRPLLEASLSQKPVVVSNWSGHLDFLDPEMSILLPGELKQIHPSAAVPDMILSESAWFTVDYKKAAETLEDVYKNYKKYTDRAKKQAYRSRTEFSLGKMGENLISILDNKVPKPVQLKLPQLKKIELPKLKKVD
jgi:glycosyltransferase involved in cell wall biosynthesis